MVKSRENRHLPHRVSGGSQVQGGGHLPFRCRVRRVQVSSRHPLAESCPSCPPARSLSDETEESFCGHEPASPLRGGFFVLFYVFRPPLRGHGHIALS